MRRPLKIAAWFIGALVMIVGFVIIPPLWMYWSWYPKAWSAKVIVNGRVAPNSRLYADLRKERAVIVRRELGVLEYYFVGLMPNDRRFVWRCENYGFSFLPGVAFSNHVQFGQACMAGNIRLEDTDGKPISSSKHERNRELTVQFRTIEFTGDDGKRIRVEW
ncbi:MAG TPA: hypothetical protein VN442_08645 [Bryobacteraceae bacterium]|nr:hypothetical protein [Bryobacteraceae bacterium]